MVTEPAKNSHELWPTIGKQKSPLLYWPTRSQQRLLDVAWDEHAVRHVRDLLAWQRKRDRVDVTLLSCGIGLIVASMVLSVITVVVPDRAKIPLQWVAVLAYLLAVVLALIVAIRQRHVRGQRRNAMMVMRLLAVADRLSGEADQLTAQTDEQAPSISSENKPLSRETKLLSPRQKDDRVVFRAREISSSAALFWRFYKKAPHRQPPRPLQASRRAAARRGSQVLNSYLAFLDTPQPDYQAVADDLRRAALRVAANEWRQVERLNPQVAEAASSQPGFLRALSRDDTLKIIAGTLAVAGALVGLIRVLAGIVSGT